MGPQHHFHNLQNVIFGLSSNKISWHAACNEWVYVGKEESITARCACDHIIKYDHWIENVSNGNIVSVGSICIRQFMSEGDELIKTMYWVRHILNRTSLCIRCSKPTRSMSGYHKKCMDGVDGRMGSQIAKIEADLGMNLGRDGLLILQSKLKKHPKAELPALMRQVDSIIRPEIYIDKYSNLAANIDMPRLTEKEREFVTVSVRNRITHGYRLSSKQLYWLKQIMQRARLS